MHGLDAGQAFESRTAAGLFLLSLILTGWRPPCLIQLQDLKKP